MNDRRWKISGWLKSVRMFIEKNTIFHWQKISSPPVTSLLQKVTFPPPSLSLYSKSVYPPPFQKTKTVVAPPPYWPAKKSYGSAKKSPPPSRCPGCFPTNFAHSITQLDRKLPRFVTNIYPFCKKRLPCFVLTFACFVFKVGRDP